MTRPVEDPLELLNAALTSAAVATALETGLFWLLDERPRPLEAIAGTLGIPLRRCGYWLQLVTQAGLLEEGPDGLRPSEAARTGILNRYSRDTWAFLALEARERYPAGVDLARAIRRGPALDAGRAQPNDYVTMMAADPERARRFTRMLYELHQGFAGEIALHFDLAGVARLLDVGGGSGVLSQALVRRYPGLSAVVVDIASVCEAGRAIARENGLADRVTYHAADLSTGALPGGFDYAIMCDVGTFGEPLFQKVRAALNPGGRFAIVDDFAPSRGVAPDARVSWALARSLTDASYEVPTADDVERMVSRCGFRVLRVEPLRAAGEADLMTIIEAGKQ